MANILSDETPLLSSSDGEESYNVQQQEDSDSIQNPGQSIDSFGLACLCLQHCSSSFGDRLAEFAFPLYLVELFTGTLLPASIYGFTITVFGILFSGSVASRIDFTPRLRAVRCCILGQKLSASSVYAVFLAMFSQRQGSMGSMNNNILDIGSQFTAWIFFAGIVVGGTILKLATVGITVAVERDWATQISGGSEDVLTRINLILRRVDLLSNLLAPFFVSSFATFGSYLFSVYFLLGLSCLSALFEFIWIEVVYLRFPVLKEAPVGQSSTRPSPERPTDRRTFARLQTWRSAVLSWLKAQRNDWRTFASYPIFMSSVSISFLYLSVLSFDPTFLSYIKSTTDFSDIFISAMRGICVLTGMLGTFIVPFLQRKLGLTRAGSWSIGAEFVSLSPTLITFYVGTTYHRPTWNVILLFTGLALSRIGLWSFDIVQLTQLQMALATHPRRNALTGLHFALQNIFDLFHYCLTIVWSSPSQFKYAATVSCCSVFIAFIVYLFGYSRRLRGHVLHLERLCFLLQRRDPQFED